MTAAKKKNLKYVFGSKHANQVLGSGQNKVIQFQNFRYETTNPEEIKLLMGAINHSDPISKIVLLEKIDLDVEEAKNQDSDNDANDKE